MAFRLNADEPVPEALQRIAGDEIECGANALAGSQNGADRDEAIHEARKSIKKVRSILRLVPQHRALKDENRRLQAAGRDLSVYRDARAAMDVFDSLRERFKGEVPDGALESVRRGLLARKEAEERAGLDRTLKGALATLRSAGKRAKTWRFEGDGFDAIAGGLEQAYRRGRKAFRTARDNPRPETFHEWRKRVKDHWYHVRLLEDLWPAVMTAYEHGLKDLQDWLGDDHNLSVLREKIAADPAFYGAAAETDSLPHLIGAYQEELRAKALEAGRRIYAEQPKALRKRVGQFWRAWYKRPVSAARAKTSKPPEPSQRETAPQAAPAAAKAAGRGGHRHGAAKKPRRSA